jgi:hypothetical protein
MNVLHKAPQCAGKGPQLLRLAENMLKKRLRTADMKWRPSFELGMQLTSHPKNKLYRNYTKGFRFGRVL